MAAGVITLFAKNKDDYRLNDLSGANIRGALVTSAWTPAITTAGNALWADVSANEIANGNGYTTGGVTLTGVIAANAGTTGYKFSTGDATWTASGTGVPAWRYFVLYYLGTIWGQVNPLIGYCLGDSTPADVPLTTAPNVLTVACPATGWFDET